MTIWKGEIIARLRPGHVYEHHYTVIRVEEGEKVVTDVKCGHYLLEAFVRDGDNGRELVLCRPIDGPLPHTPRVYTERAFAGQFREIVSPAKADPPPQPPRPAEAPPLKIAGTFHEEGKGKSKL
jgi:hypothetical protein